MKLTIFVVVLLFALCSATYVPRELPCNRTFKCSLQEKATWATDGRTCYGFRNSCILAKENCQRQNRYENVLTVISKKDCQTKCNGRCTKNMKPVCGYYKDVQREFSNRCLMDYYICSSGETYMLLNEGRCQLPLTPETK